MEINEGDIVEYIGESDWNPNFHTRCLEHGKLYKVSISILNHIGLEGREPGMRYAKCTFRKILTPATELLYGTKDIWNQK